MGKKHRRRNKARAPGTAALAAMIIFVWSVAGGAAALSSLWSSVETSVLSRIEQNYVQFEKGADGVTWIAKCYCGHALSGDEIPQTVKDAIISIEDRRFRMHNGIDAIGIARAIAIKVLGGKLQGGSTLTQQLVKFQLLNLETTWTRKLQEIGLAFQLESGMTKDEILEAYINRAVFTSVHNQPIVGLEAASRVFYSKHAKDLTLFESAQIAAVLQNPKDNDPRTGAKKSLERTKLVLSAMVSEGYITAAERDAALAKGATPGDVAPFEFEYRYFTEFVRAELVTSYPEVPLREDLRIFVAFDPVAQFWANHAIKTARRRDGPRVEGAVVSLDHVGRIVAISGGSDFAAHETNRATAAWRQPASSFKLFPYLAAIEAGVAPSDMIDASRPADLSWGGNPDGIYPDEMSMLDAFAKSSNSAARHLTSSVGVDAVAGIARRLGVSAPLDDGDYLALGITEVSLLEMTGAYAVVANGGIAVRPHAIISVANTSGTLLGSEELTTERALAQQDAKAARVLLREVVWHGTASLGANISSDAAGKTGTGQGGMDAWFVGYTDDLVTGISLGRDDFRPVPGLSGAKVAELWGSYNSNVRASR